MIRLSSITCYTAIILLILLSQHVAGQQGTIPCGLNYKIYKTISEKSFQAIDTTSFASERPHTSGKISWGTVAYNFKTHFVPDTDGSWQTLLPGVDSWFLKLRSDGAYGLAVVFSDVKLMPGETLH